MKNAGLNSREDSTERHRPPIPLPLRNPFSSSYRDSRVKGHGRRSRIKRIGNGRCRDGPLTTLDVFKRAIDPACVCVPLAERVYAHPPLRTRSDGCSFLSTIYAPIPHIFTSTSVERGLVFKSQEEKDTCPSKHILPDKVELRNSARRGYVRQKIRSRIFESFQMYCRDTRIRASLEPAPSVPDISALTILPWIAPVP